MTSEILVKIVELAILGDRQSLILYVQSLLQSSKKIDRKSIHKLTDLLDSYHSNEFTFSSAEESNDFQLPKLESRLWMDQSLSAEVSRFIKLHKRKETGSVRYMQSKFNKLLLYGPPGTGKTLLSLYIAREINQKAIYVKLSDVISYRFGETLRNLSEIFENPNNRIIILDEFDALAKRRSDSNDIGELKRIVNSLIQSLDMYTSEKIIIASTNLIESIDPAIVRRFSVKVEVPTISKDNIESFIYFTLENVVKDEKGLKLAAKEIRTISELLSLLEINTPYEIQMLIDKVVMESLIEKRRELTARDFVEVILESKFFMKNYFKKLHKESSKDLNKILNIAKEHGITKSWLAQTLDVHRNTVSNYDK